VEVELIPIKVSVAKALRRIKWRRLWGGRKIKADVVKGFYERYSDIIGV
jgi:predicted ABC-type ATPase